MATGALILIVGLVAGVLSGMFGVGGAVLTTPGIRALGTTPIDAVGSTVPAILPGALSGAYRYAKEGLVEWRIAWACGLAGSALAVAGAWVADIVDARWLMLLTAVLLAWSGVSVIREARASDRNEAATDRSAGPGATVAIPSTPVLAAVGAGAGFAAGLLGVGGGVVMMPLFTTVLRIPVKVAVGSSLVAVAMFSVPALITHAVLDHIDWPVALLLLAGAVVGAQIGARITIGLAERTAQYLLGTFFLVVAVLFGGGEILALI
jgi:hypothetical protein